MYMRKFLLSFLLAGIGLPAVAKDILTSEEAGKYIREAGLPRSSFSQDSKPATGAQHAELTDLIKQTMSSVVFIEVRDAADRAIGTGSGFIASADGKVVTNNHVVRDAHSAYVKLSNGAFFKADGLITSDAQADVAVLKVAGSNLPALTLSDSDKAVVGQPVVAIGSPLGFENSVSNGIISGLREDSGRKWIQTTAAASPGNSGGPLLSLTGEVVGIVTWKKVGGENLNFAVPANVVKSLLASAGSTVKPFDSATPRFKFATGQVVYVMTNDLSIKRSAEEQFAKDRQFKVSVGPSGADFVFVAIWDTYSNEELALVVLPDQYARHKDDLDDLRDHALWQGGGQTDRGWRGLAWSPSKSEIKALVRKFEREAFLKVP